MTKNKKVKIGISIAIISLIVLSSVFIASAFVLNRPAMSSISFKGYDDGIKLADRNGNYTSLNINKQLNADFSLELNNVYLGIKRIIISYTLTSKGGKIPSDYKNEEISNKCSISIDGKKYDIVDVTLASNVIEGGTLEGALLLDESNYGTDFVLSENSVFNVSFNNLLNINKDIDFEFQVDMPNISKDQINFDFKYKNKKYTIKSIELDSITTTLNFSKAVNIKDMKIVQNNETYDAITVSNKGQHYISFPAVQRGIPFTIYIGNEKLHTSTHERIYAHTFD
ncbi:hypothetical protein CIB95_08025 [Lottiidibacillus patelloidae]|uniref:DUF4179 domain-containing protein n=1 Tax=Lottiidibacillus patelloidae TaxID=2670334 RepID=A0A263BV05_9BACI|nr:DUF4179 domain-containing protein [Lottiidibacillus patelloidae]OZM57398.1 hypothetical protein CIB95_08025 [Lottiidibacillus patelloidae]